MKPIVCPMCGKEMIYFHSVLEGCYFMCTTQECDMRKIAIRGNSEKEARRAWNKSLIGQLMKFYKKHTVSHQWYPGSIGDILNHMFGGTDDSN